MITTKVDPWTWQERYGYAQAWRVDGATGLVFVAGPGMMLEVEATAVVGGREEHS